MDNSFNRCKLKIPLTDEIEKEQRVEIQQRAFENQQDYIRQQEKFIERFKAKADFTG